MTPETTIWTIVFAALNGAAGLLLILGKPRATPDTGSGSPRQAAEEDSMPGDPLSAEPPGFMVAGCPVDPPRVRGERRLVQDLERWRATIEGGEFLPESAGNCRPEPRESLVGSLNDVLA